MSVCCFHSSTLGQHHKEKFQPSYKSRIDLSMFIFPNKSGFYQNYQLYAQTNIKGRFGLGVGMSYANIDPKDDFSSNSVDYRFSIGSSFELFDLKRINLMTYSHLVYNNVIHPLYPTVYYGGGVVQGLRFNFRLGQFGIGVRSHIQITYGLARNIIYPEGIWVHDASWGYGVNFTYFIPK